MVGSDDQSSNMWTCDQCQTDNAEDQWPCVECGYPLVKSRETLTTSFDTPKLVKSDKTDWFCTHCRNRNPQNVTRCVNCKTKKARVLKQQVIAENQRKNLLAKSCVHITRSNKDQFLDEEQANKIKESFNEPRSWMQISSDNFSLHEKLANGVTLSDLIEESNITRIGDFGGAIVLHRVSEDKETLGEVTGVLFRVWAPNAKQISVIGDWNKWRVGANYLKKESDGQHWQLVVPEARPGNSYRYVLTYQENNDVVSVYRNDPRGEILALNGDSEGSWNNVIYDQQAFKWTDDDYEAQPIQNLVLYELHVGSFTTSGCSNKFFNQNQDVEQKRIGTFKEIEQKLDYFEKLGINGLALLPITQDVHEKPFNCWGYDPVSLFAVHSDYGSPDDLKSLINQAHNRGMAVFIDLVPNHFAEKNVLNNFDGPKDIYFPSDVHKKATDWGPRLDYSSEHVRQYIVDSGDAWLRNFHFDGIRVDSTGNIRYYYVDGNRNTYSEGWLLLQELNDMVHNNFPSKFTIAEDLIDDSGMLNLGGAGFDVQWDEHYFKKLLQSVICVSDNGRDMVELGNSIAALKLAGNVGGRVIFTENHDTVPADRQGRIPTAILRGHQSDWPPCEDVENNYFAQKRTALVTAVMITTPGLPMLLQGQEWFETCAPVWPNGPIVDLERAERDVGKGCFDLWKDLIHFRRNLDNITMGLLGSYVRVFHINNQPRHKLIAYHRWYNGGAGDDVVIVANFSNIQFTDYRLGFPRSGEWILRFNSDDPKYKMTSQNFEVTNRVNTTAEARDGYPFAGTIRIGAYSALIFSQNPRATVTFKVDYSKSLYGDRMAVSGSSAMLGNWNLERAVMLKTGYCDVRYPHWKSHRVPIIHGDSHKYKVVLFRKCAAKCPHQDLQKVVFNNIIFHPFWQKGDDQELVISESKHYEIDCGEVTFDRI